jgi:uncharacterized membrane protein YjfL (UPF0719 family)
MQYLLGLLYFLFAFMVSIFTIYICFKLVMRITKYNDIKLMKENNTAVSIVLAAAFIAMAIMARHSLYPIGAAVQDFWLSDARHLSGIAGLIIQSLSYLMAALGLSLISVIAALTVFQKLTRDIEEEQEIMNNNTAIAILMAGVLIAFALMIESGISDCINTMIPINPL